ncbi:MAG: hypothetical protein LQ343_007776 [Gyalolechia ehrenbergii]|nr:MAG: hypothetical protein LQ343_007776 [Gyalolechia ehrenbergii]
MSEPSDHNASDSVSPPVRRRQRSGGNDSLWKRAKKTLGNNSLTFLQPQNKPATASTKAVDPSGRSPAVTNPGKRREQVRNAQRTHRQRTQNYIKTLESEVIRLRGSEGDLTEKNKKLQDQVELLRTSLILANVPLPAGFEGSPQLAQPTPFDLDMPATVAFKPDSSNHQRLHVSWPSPPANRPAPAPVPAPVQQPEWAPASLNENTMRERNLSGSKPLPSLPKVSPTTYQSSLPAMISNVDTPEVAVDFVLALEYPCMQHLPHPSDPSSEDPSNHTLMVSTPLVSSAPRSFQRCDTNWTANATMIKGLLNLSLSINLEGEITPVEAWHRLRQHPNFARLDKWAIEKIKADLSASVRCEGFGAVLDENTFNFAVESILGPV